MMARNSKNNRFIIVMIMCAIFICGTIYIALLNSSNANNFMAFARVNSQSNTTNTSQLNAAVNSLNFTSAALF
jgi:cytochrome c-type biogenesis protein CcmE